MRKEIYNLHQLCGVYRLQHLGMKMNWAIQYFVRLVSFRLSFEGRGYTTELTSIAVKVSIDNEQISECKRKLRWSNYCFAATDRYLNSFSHKNRRRIEFPTLEVSFHYLGRSVYNIFVILVPFLFFFYLGLSLVEIWECILNV